MSNVLLNQFIQWSSGNPGAALFLVGLVEEKNIQHAIPVMNKLEKCSTIRGTNLYILFNDLCDRNYAKVGTLCEKCPNDVLEDACSRQDRSGIELVKEYLNN